MSEAQVTNWVGFGVVGACACILVVVFGMYVQRRWVASLFAAIVFVAALYACAGFVDSGPYVAPEDPTADLRNENQHPFMAAHRCDGGCNEAVRP